MVNYLDSFATVQEQFNDIPLTFCAPALPVRTACITVLTSASTSISCPSVTGDGQTCVTFVETITETNTHTPHWPTLNGSFTDLKQTAARLTTETGEATTVQATAEPVLEPASQDSADEPEPSIGSGSQTPGSSEVEITETSAEDIPESTITETEVLSPTDTVATTTSSGDVGSGSVSDSEGPSPSTGSPTVDTSAATFTGAGSRFVIPSWSLALLGLLFW